MMRRNPLWLPVFLCLPGCGRIDSIPYQPTQTPETWLQMQPFIELQVASRSFLIVQPSTSAIVYLLGILTIGVGLHFLRIRGEQRARLWWGLALILWGVGAILAGTSYEAFSYQIKCAGRAACAWTSGWEIAYLLVSVASVNAMLAAQAYACAAGKWRRRLQAYALFNMAAYGAALLVGAWIPVPFLISFELLLVFCAPTIVFFIAHNGWRYYRRRQRVDLSLLWGWLWLALTIGAYFLYLVSGFTQRLWAQDIWFSENDVLHIGLIVWMVYLAWAVAPQVVDQAESVAIAPLEA